jgi:hypothetical protein
VPGPPLIGRVCCRPVGLSSDGAWVNPATHTGPRTHHAHTSGHHADHRNAAAAAQTRWQQGRHPARQTQRGHKRSAVGAVEATPLNRGRTHWTSRAQHQLLLGQAAEAPQASTRAHHFQLQSQLQRAWGTAGCTRWWEQRWWTQPSQHARTSAAPPPPARAITAGHQRTQALHPPPPPPQQTWAGARAGGCTHTRAHAPPPPAPARPRWTLRSARP